MIGTILGDRYELIEKIGEGGMAEVFKAKCHLLNRYVAVKILKEQYNNDTEFVKKFKQEATAAASLSDNNIVNIYDVGSQGNINYIVMEYVDGKTLKQLINEKGKFPSNVTIDIAIQIAKGLDCAHKNNLIHRDIKPHNILVTEEGVIKVTDFGIAKVSDSVTITNTNKILGSAHYFSPEQAKGNYVDFRTDIYSFGIVLYEMVTGRVPFDAETPLSVALKHINEPVVPPIDIVDSVPNNLNALILKCIEKEPIKRYQTVKDILYDLQRIKENPNYMPSNSLLQDNNTKIMDPFGIDDFTEKIDAVDDNDFETDEIDYIEEDDGYEIEDENEDKDNKAKKTTLIATIFLIVAVIGGILGAIAANKNLKLAGKVRVPRIIGLTKEEAKEKIEEKDLIFVYAGKEKSNKPKDTVIKCNPKEGKKVKIKSEVRVIVSNGKDDFTVPDVTGINVNSAKDMIRSHGLQVGNVMFEYNDEVPENIVISQSPKADTPANKYTKVNLVVSKGPKDGVEKVPNVIGKSLNEARAILNAEGFRIGNAQPVLTNDRSQDGMIFEQSPGANSKARIGSSIDVRYYRYSTAP